MRLKLIFSYESLDSRFATPPLIARKHVLIMISLIINVVVAKRVVLHESETFVQQSHRLYGEWNEWDVNRGNLSPS